MFKPSTNYAVSKKGKYYMNLNLFFTKITINLPKDNDIPPFSLPWYFNSIYPSIILIFSWNLIPFPSPNAIPHTCIIESDSVKRGVPGNIELGSSRKG